MDVVGVVVEVVLVVEVVAGGVGVGVVVGGVEVEDVEDGVVELADGVVVGAVEEKIDQRMKKIEVKRRINWMIRNNQTIRKK